MADGKALSKTMRIDLPPEDASQIRRRMLLTPQRDVPSHLRDPRDRQKGSADFQDFFDNIYDGVLITEGGGRIRDANPRAVQFLAYSNDELLKMFIDQVVSGLDSQVLESIETTLQKNRHVFIQGYCVKKDATTFPVDIAVNRLILGQSQFFCFFLRDISLRRETEELLLREHQALHSLKEAVLICDETGTIHFANPAALALWGFEEDVSLKGGELTSLIFDTEILSEVWQKVAAGESWGGILKLAAVREDDTHVAAGVTISPTYNQDDEFNGAVLTFTEAIG